MKKRDYRKEYDSYHARTEQRAARSNRNKARRQMEKEGRVRKGDGMEVDHKDGNPMNNRKSNLQVLTRRANRRKGD